MAFCMFVLFLKKLKQSKFVMLLSKFWKSNDHKNGNKYRHIAYCIL